MTKTDSAPIPTTQNAPLERFLARQRTHRVRSLVTGRVVLDFGCGNKAWASRSLQPFCKRIDGLEPTLPAGSVHGIQVFPSLEQLRQRDYEVEIALAVFEHLHPHELEQVLFSSQQ